MYTKEELEMISKAHAEIQRIIGEFERNTGFEVTSISIPRIYVGTPEEPHKTVPGLVELIIEMKK